MIVHAMAYFNDIIRHSNREGCVKPFVYEMINISKIYNNLDKKLFPSIFVAQYSISLEVPLNLSTFHSILKWQLSRLLRSLNS